MTINGYNGLTYFILSNFKILYNTYDPFSSDGLCVLIKRHKLFEIVLHGLVTFELRMCGADKLFTAHECVIPFLY